MPFPGPSYDDLHSPVPAGTVDLAPVEGEPGVFRSLVPLDNSDEVTLLVACDAPEFPFEQHCRFVRQKTPGGPYTFASMEFRERPPGLRVGPWPGWRGIPEMPGLVAFVGGRRHELKVMFWGDELSQRHLRAVCVLPSGEGGALTVTTPDPRIVPRRVHLYTTYTVFAQKVPVRLRPELKGVHPRLLITPDQIVSQRKKAAGSHQAYWAKILALLGHWDLPYEQTPESKAVEGPQRLSAEDRVLLSAWVALIEPGRDTVGFALGAYDDYRQLTAAPGFEPLLIDTQAGEVLFILSVGYDLLAGSMTPQQKEAAKQRLYEVAEICSSHLGEERRDYAQAHYLGCGLGLLAFSFLFWGEHPRAAEWAARLRGALACVLGLLPPDGFYPHGINLWIYEFGQLLRWLELFRICTGEDLWHTAPGLSKASEFRGATLSPDSLYGVTMGDPQFRVGGDSWCHFLIASRTGSDAARWLGERLLDLPHDGVDVRSVPARRRVYEFLYSEPAIGKPPPATAHFEDGGQVCVREGESLFTFRSGPPLGSRRYRSGEYGGYGHSDPCNGAFLLVKGGTFIASGPGPVYRRDSSLHNVVTVNGQGQIGDSTVWMPDFLPPEALAERAEVRVEGALTFISVDLASAYLPHLGVERCRRAVCVRGGCFVLGVDIVRCREHASIEWNAHAWKPFTRLPGGAQFEFLPGTRLVILEPADVVCETGVTEFVPAYPNPGRCDHQLRATVFGREARFVWCYLLDGQEAPVILTGPPLRFRFAGGPALECDGERFRTEGAP